MPACSRKTKVSQVSAMGADGLISTNNRASALHTSGYPIFPFFSHTAQVPHSYSWERTSLKIQSLYHYPKPSLHSSLATAPQPHLLFPPALSSSSIYTTVWDTDNSAVASHHAPIHIHLKDPSKLPNQPRHPISQKHQQGLKPIVTNSYTRASCAQLTLPVTPLSYPSKSQMAPITWPRT